VFGGAGEVSFEPPKEYAHVGSGGAKFGGAGVVGFILPSDETVSDLAITGSGGFIFGGAGIIEFVEPDVLAIIGSGGFKFGGFRVPEFEVVKFIDPDLILEASTTPVVMEFGGEGIIEEFKPTAAVYEVPQPHAAAEATMKFGGKGDSHFC